MNGDSSTTATTAAPARASRPAWWTLVRRALTLWRRDRSWRRPLVYGRRMGVVAGRVELRPPGGG
jgi:hypothetical protein